MDSLKLMNDAADEATKMEQMRVKKLRDPNWQVNKKNAAAVESGINESVGSKLSRYKDQAKKLIGLGS